MINDTNDEPFEWVEESLFYDTSDSNFRSINFTTTAAQV